MPNLALLALEASDGTVVLTSITLVFAMLVALCLIITLEGKIFDAINNKKNNKPAAPKASPLIWQGITNIPRTTRNWVTQSR